ncbi:MAG: hypothetical protein HRF43_02465 [Phycisphaerae bacterium]|jgi:hypothetical protein
MAQHDSSTSRRSARNPVIRLLDTVGNIWFGVVMLVLIFLYASIGSAVPPVRQGALADVIPGLSLEFLRFEKSDMEWFSWWPFVTLIVLFCASIIIVTLRRIPLTLVNAGVWAIHAGIVLMAGACLYYFGTKVEGDTIIYQSLARIRVPGAPEATLAVRPGATAFVGGGASQYRLEVTNVNPAYTPLSGRFKGQRVQQVWFNVTSTGPAGSFIRTMLVGDPENTEDLLVGPGGAQRAVKVTGGKILDPDLQIVLDYDPVKYFYHSHELPVRSNGAIYVRPAGTTEWTELRVDWLPHYYEHLSHHGELWPTEGLAKMPARPLRLPAVPESGAEWLKGLDIRVTDYLPYARLERRFVSDEASVGVNPVLRFRLGTNPDKPPIELLAADPNRNQTSLMEGFSARFAWAPTAAARQEWTRPRDPRVTVRVGSKSLEKVFKLSELSGAGPVALEGTDYKLELADVAGPGQLAPGIPGMVLIRVTRGASTFSRVVTAGDAGGGEDIDRRDQPPADPDIQFTYADPITPGLLFVGGPDSDKVDVMLTLQSGRSQRVQAAVGESAELLPAVPIRIEELLAGAREEVRPAIIPPVERQSLRNVGKKASLVRVEINDGQRTQSAWLRFNEYPFPDAQRARPPLTPAFDTRMVQVAGGDRPGGRVIEMMYSRQREPLAAPVALERFILETHPGGDREADFISLVRFQQGDGWSKKVEIRSNQPAQHGPYWYFQSKWDPQTECHTVLGVGNRNGVGAMLAGVCISIAGMIYAFYVKPAIIRRRKRAALELAALRGTPASGSPAPAERRAPGPRPIEKPSEMTRV